MRLMREGAILANAGHFNVEIDMMHLGKGNLVRPGLEEHSFQVKKSISYLKGGLQTLLQLKGVQR